MNRRITTLAAAAAVSTALMTAPAALAAVMTPADSPELHGCDVVLIEPYADLVNIAKDGDDGYLTFECEL